MKDNSGTFIGVFVDDRTAETCVILALVFGGLFLIIGTVAWVCNLISKIKKEKLGDQEEFKEPNKTENQSEVRGVKKVPLKLEKEKEDSNSIIDFQERRIAKLQKELDEARGIERTDKNQKAR